MGKEADCRAVIDGVATRGRAMLETDDIRFRGTPRLKVLLAEIKKVSVEGGILQIRHKKGDVSFDLGPKQAQAWAKRILEPPGLLDKLGVKEGSIVTAIGLADEDFAHSLELRGATVRVGRKGKDADLVLLGAEKLADLQKLDGLTKLIRPGGGIWIVYPKGRPKGGDNIRAADVMAAGRDRGLKDNKTCRFSETHTALRFVIPVAARGPR